MEKPRTDELTLDQAYQAAFLWFDHKGEPPLEISEPVHGSVQLITESTFARVRWATSPADQASVLSAMRFATDDKRVAIFSASGFTTGAISVAETQGIALYALDSWGVAHAKTTHARSLAPKTPPDPPFAPPQPQESATDYWMSQTPAQAPSQHQEPEETQPAEPTVTNPDDWSECPTCGMTHFRTAKYCRDCGTHLRSGARHARDLSVADLDLTCETCGGTDIKLRGT
ncbi:MAG: hypothetical protein M5U23_00825 [Acidimicrobiia bacterium]|nr:hypothetical protein [Acidimicrobiia bacterium]